MCHSLRGGGGDESIDLLCAIDECEVLLLVFVALLLLLLLVLLLQFDDADDKAVDDIDDGYTGDNSYRPNNFSSSFGSLAPGKSCLLARISTGVP